MKVNGHTNIYYLMPVFMLMLLIMPFTSLGQDFVVHPSLIGTGVFLGETPPLRDIPALTDEEWKEFKEKDSEEENNPDLAFRYYPFSDKALPKGPDQARQKEMGANRDTHAPAQGFTGSNATGNPSDANGAIGPNYYMQTVNTVYTIYNRAGAVVAGPTPINTLFYNLPGADVNDGDPIILYDEQADRWLVAEFSYTGANDYMLIAVSTTNDPTGTWYKYSFDVADMPDYEKFGIWQDGYYMSTSNSSGNDIYVFQRTQMLSGQSAQMVGFDNPWRPSSSSTLSCAPPLDNDGVFAPSGEPGLFIAFNDDAYGGGSDQLWIYELDVDWVTPASSTFVRTQQINVTAFDSNFGTTQANISQQGTTQKVDAIPQVIMNPPQYRNFGTYETIVCCHTVDVDNTDHAGIRWYELRRVNSGDWTIRQQSTYSPDSHSRWMGSIMLNGANELALGYSISSSTLYPGIRYCGQSSTAYNAGNSTMDVAEDIIQVGAFSNKFNTRWGDYSAMQVDMTDNETFWFTSQYISGTTNPQTVKTRIANFQIGTIILTANFAVSNTTPEINTTVKLTDVSFGSPTSWNWIISPSTYNFVGGTSSTSQNPQVQFTAAGSYTITMTAVNGANSDSETKSNFITVSDCGISYLPFAEDFSDGVLPPCWKNIDNVGNGHVWQFNNPGARVIHTTSAANGFAILDSYNYGISYQQNADLISPLLDLSAYTAVNLYFEYFFPAYTPNLTSALGRLYYSTNDGATWSQLLSTNNSANPTVYNVNLTSQLAGQSRVRLKWNYTGYGYYWAIDDINLTGTGPNQWTGTTSTDWATATNWSTGTVPTSTSKVIIPTTATNWPTYTGNLAVGTNCDKITLYGSSQMTVTGNVTIDAGKTIAVIGNGQINIGGNWTNNGTFSPGTGTIRFYGTGTSTVTNGAPSNIASYIRDVMPQNMTALTGATVGPTGNDAGININPLGFTFNYLGTNYTRARLCTNGWLMLATGTSTLTTNTNDVLFTTSAPNLTLAPWFDDLSDDGTSVVSYKMEGTSPNRVFIAEWKSVLTYSAPSTERISFQVKLYETSNIIEFAYGNLEPGTNNASESASIGIEDAAGGSGRFIEATTGSYTTGVTNLTDSLNWPTVNYRFSPPSATQTFWNVIVEKTSTTATFSSNTTANGNFTITSGTAVGPGTLNVKGNWVNNGTYTPGSGTVVFNGSSNQNIGGSTSTTFTNLTIINPSGITFQGNETVSGTLTMTSGNVNCGAYTLQLGTSTAAVGTLSWTSGNIIGNFKRWIAATTVTAINFPVGTASYNNNVKITFTNNTGGSLTAKFEPGDPGGNSGFPLTENAQTINAVDQYTDGSWTLVPTTLTSTSYALELTGNGFTTVGPLDAEVRILKRPDGGGAWTLNGTHVAGSPPIAKRTGLSGFSRFALAKPCNTPATVTPGGPDATCVSSVPVPITLSGASVGGSATTAAWSITSLNPANGGNNGTLSSTAYTSTPATVTYTPPANYAGTVTLTLTSEDPAGSCSPATGNRTVTVNTRHKISGGFTYYNQANTPLTSGITVKLYQGGSQVGSDFIVTSGSYEFPDLCPGTYELRASSSQSTDGSVNSTDAAQANYWGAIPYEIEKVRFYAGDVTGATYYINSTDALRIQGNFVNGTAFDKGTWTFWKAGETISSNSSPSESYPTVTLSGSDLTTNIYGLCAGDFNRSFTPGLARSAGNAISLSHPGVVQAVADQEIELPLHILNPQSIGAVSLILIFPSDLADIKDVSVNDAGELTAWDVSRNELRIGWNSLNPLYLDSNDILLTLKLKTTGAFTSGRSISFSLAENPLNEIADEHYNPIGNARLSLDNIEATAIGIDEQPGMHYFDLSCYPNPFSNQAQISYDLPVDGYVMLEISNILGVKLNKLVSVSQSAGSYSVKFNMENLPAGMYIATLKLEAEGKSLVKTLKLINQ